jgi:regulator of protease activity HflC (stomatin/prohibitin superfamily)
MSPSSSDDDVFGIVAAVAAVIVVVLLLVLGGIWLSSFDRTDGGTIAVIRNGGPFDNTKIRQVLQPNSGRKYIGFFSTSHKYPSTQRTYTITSDTSRGDKSGVDVAYVPSSDGVEVGVEGTVYFTLNADPKVVSDFDNKYGTRTFTGLDGKSNHAYDGTEGWSNMLDQVVRPVIDNALRSQVGDFTCADLISSCALVQNSNNPNAATAALGKTNNNSHITQVQQAVDSALQTDINNQLGGPYFNNIRFNLSRVTLPAQVQNAINDAQSAFAAITQSQAKVRSAQADAQANVDRQKGYAACPACGVIDELHALPQGVNTLSLGSGSPIAISGK